MRINESDDELRRLERKHQEDPNDPTARNAYRQGLLRAGRTPPRLRSTAPTPLEKDTKRILDIRDTSDARSANLRKQLYSPQEVDKNRRMRLRTLAKLADTRRDLTYPRSEFHLDKKRPLSRVSSEIKYDKLAKKRSALKTLLNKQYLDRKKK